MASNNASILAMNPYGQTVGDTTFKTLADLTNIFNVAGRNKEMGLKNAFTQATQPNAVEWANLKNALDTKYYPQEKRVGLDQSFANLGLTGAQTQHQNALTTQARAQTNLLGQKENPFNQFKMTLSAYNQSENGTPEKQYFGALLNKMIGANAGMSGAGLGAAPSQNNGGAPANMSLANWVKDPRTGQAKSGAGSAFINPETGEVRASLTTNQKGREQKTIAGIQNLKAYLNEITKTVPQFLTAKEKAALGLKGAGNYFLGMNFPEPSEYALGQSAILSSAEGFVNAFGLNATNENVSKAEHIMTPMKGESKEFYIKRVEKQLSEFADQQKRAEDRLREGVSLGQTTEPVQQGGFFGAQGYVPPSIRQPELQKTDTDYSKMTLEQLQELRSQLAGQ